MVRGDETRVLHQPHILNLSIREIKSNLPLRTNVGINSVLHPVFIILDPDPDFAQTRPNNEKSKDKYVILIPAFKVDNILLLEDHIL